MDAEQTLSSVPLFAGLDTRSLKRLAEQAKRRTYAAGDPIIRQDAPASALYVITKGRVRVHEGGDEGATLTELIPGEFFGELALIEDRPRTASVTAVEETECMLFVAWEFTALLKEHPDIAVPIMHELIKRLHRREGR
ncbi:MAG TPA: cyclic nucleotide-binding domain-containing protein [Candidatus Limnocylindria bacterium]|nr:cyclic nucleotide-binding domain-containing protein [Candidatus Limnocylindria bacterium]